jgi:hypothetical protein
VDVGKHQLIMTASMKVIRAVAPSGGPGGLFTAVTSSSLEYRHLFDEFQDVAQHKGEFPAPKHDVQHHLQTSGPPLTAKARRLDPAKLQDVKREFEDMEKAGIIRRSDSSWASPLHMVRKANSTWRPCGDYRRLNKVTKADRFPVPNIQDFTARLHGCMVFSKLDLRKGYYQVPVRAEDIPKTAVITPFGLWEFLRMPFGLKNAGQSFQRLIDRLMASLDFVFVYLDDILSASPDQQTHLQHLRLVLERLREGGLLLNMDKCQFGAASLEFLGHMVSAGSLQPLSSHVQAIMKVPWPLDTTQLQRFLGMINFYRRFIPSASHRGTEGRPQEAAHMGAPGGCSFPGYQAGDVLSRLPGASGPSGGHQSGCRCFRQACGSCPAAVAGQGLGPPGLLQQEVGGRPAKVFRFLLRIAGGIPGGQAFPQHAARQGVQHPQQPQAAVFCH